MEKFKIIDCPRDAMQGWHDFIPTENKIEYINQLLKVGFDTLDFGSFVSVKSIPQMRDTEDVLKSIDLSVSKTKLLAIVANEQGATKASKYNEIDYLGYPFSISETFQLRNTNATIEQSFERIKNIQKIAIDHNKKVVAYISMGFGNPYGDRWNHDLVYKWIEKLSHIGLEIFQLSDTVGTAKTEDVSQIFNFLQKSKLEIGAHFHTIYDAWRDKLEAAYDNGCRKFDGTIQGFGGCPMAQDQLIGNMPTEKIMAFAAEKNMTLNFDLDAFEKSQMMANKIFRNMAIPSN